MDKLVSALQESLSPDKYVLAFSGGADSVALALAALELYKLNSSYDFVAVHVEHGLRGEESLRDMEFAETFCKDHDLSCVIKRVDVPARVQFTGDSVEKAARDLRYRALLDVAVHQSAKKIITAHHANDQVETILLHLVRGSGLRGLGGMHKENSLVVRPFLYFTKQELVEYCQGHGAIWVEDSSNSDTEFSRNYLRSEVVPLLEKMNPALVQNLCQTAQSLQEDEELLEDFTHSVMQKRLEGAVLRTDDWNKLPLAVRKRVIKLWLQKHNVEPNWTHISNVDKLIINGTSNKELALPGITVIYACRKLFADRSAQHIRH